MSSVFCLSLYLDIYVQVIQTGLNNIMILTSFPLDKAFNLALQYILGLINQAKSTDTALKESRNRRR